MDIDQNDETLNLGASLKKERSTTRNSSTYYILPRRTLEFFLTVSLYSLLLSSCTGLSYLHSYTYYFSTFLLPFLSKVLQKKYMFLLCNGILVFLAGLSGFLGPLSSSSKTQGGLSESDDIQSMMMVTEDDAEALVLQASTPVDPLYEEGTQVGASRVEIIVGSRYNRLSSAEGLQEKEKFAAAAAAEEEEEDDDDDDDEEVREDWIKGGRRLEENEEMLSGPMVVGEEDGQNDETESEDPGSVNTEELNRKIEEFIRKMKEELWLEAQQHHLIAV